MHVSMRMWAGEVCVLVLLCYCWSASSLSNHYPDDYDDEERPIFNYNQYLRHPYSTKVDSKSKVETLGAVLKSHIHKLKDTANKEIDIIFLVDSSTSVGKNNFKEEIKFVKKLLSDFTVDVNHTRVSVITFSSRERVIRHLDYLDDTHKDRHKCSLLEGDLKSISYSGGGTFTLGAFKEAKKVFENARPTANKAIFLVTDGFSNGGDPRSEARAFRQRGVKIFTFGIQNGNVRELYDMASQPKNESCYILDSFEEFEALARRALHEDLYSGRYIEQPNKKCNRLCVGKNCCDPLATCSCGTHTGQYECICPAGHFGNGLRGGCQACPSGTYKPDVRPGDDYTCRKCPDEKHITEPGATSVEQCTCQKGYRTFNGTGCAVLKCPVLSIPKSGYFVNDKCKNVFNAACGLRCKPGYELRGSSLRICREDGTWSGFETECIMKTCPALMIPKNGNMICTTDDFTFNTVCRFTCDTGYKLVGSRKRTCLAIAFWTGINTRCREITCRPLPVVRDGSIHPAACTAGDVAFGTTCSVTCSPGYSLIGPHSKQCLPEGVWTPATDINQCVDTSPPFIMCPYNIEVDADLNEKTGTVSWQVPLAVDNSGYIPILTSVPAILPPAQFPIGRTKVTYEAEDLNKNKASCQFYIVVKDKQKPTVDRCVSPMPIVSPEQFADVTWDEPEFSDNSEEEVRIQRSHAFGLFPMGKSEVVYTAYDSSGNNNTCTLRINVIPHPCEYPPVPLNGNRSCHETSEGVVCKFSCKQGHRFAIPPAEEYLCAYDNVWRPQEKMPVSDCSALKLSKSIVQPASFTFSGKVACKHRPGLVRLEKNFEHRIGKRIDQLCQIGLICGMRDLETECTQVGDTSVHVILGRDKRSTNERLLYRRRRAAGYEETYTETIPLSEDAVVKFTYKLTGEVDPNAHVPVEKAVAEQEKLVNSVEDIVTALKKDVKTGDFDLEVNGKPLKLVNMSLDQSVDYNCDDGSVQLDNACAECPVGTFFNVVSLKCDSCNMGTFQPGRGQLSCLVCPTNYSTSSPHSISQENCTALCLPGTFSDSGLEMCETCKRGYYQNEYGQSTCNRCPKRHTTLKRGSRTLDKCKEKCKAGYISKTGVAPCWPCPQGTYQSRAGKSSCTLCPGGAQTPSPASTNISQCEMEQSDDPLQNEGPIDLFGGQEQQQLLADDCIQQPCMNDAECNSKLFGFECICKPGYTGYICDQEINECDVNPCLNDGTCTDLVGNYLCTCKPGFTGNKCEINIDDCAPDTCLNGGTCIDEVQGISCSCANGFTGLKCETNSDECKPDICLNGGTCMDEVAGYRCECPNGIRGENCEINDDDCASGPCQNNAECVDGSGTYKCNCLPGFEGVDCEIDIDECAINPCGPNAKCENLPGEYKCHCTTGFTGVSCKEEIDMLFQLDFPTTATTMDYAKVKVEKDLTTATVCFWMKTDDQENQGTPFSYATEDGDNVFTLSDYDGFVLYVNGDKITTTVRANDGRWHQICVLWFSSRGEWKFYMDGKLEIDGRNLAKGQTIKGGGILVVGQEQDVEGGDFSKPETFIGQLTQLNMWSSALSLEDIGDLRLSCRKQLGDVVAWTDIAGKVHGAVTDTPIEFCKECPTPSAPEAGSVTYDGLNAGSLAEYSCDRGYNIAGKRDRLCLVTGEWEGTEPACAKVQCPYPKIADGWIEGRVYTFDNRIRYYCDRGFSLVGDDTRYCGEDGQWVGEKPRCEVTKCKIEVLSENTILTNPTPDNKFDPGSDAFFACKEGHHFYTPHESVYCQRDGTWDESIPTCDPQSCEAPAATIKGGQFPNPNNILKFSVGYIAQYECDFGKEFSRNSLNPLGQVMCLATGLWEDNLPECVDVDCGLPRSIQHGTYEVVGTTFLHQATYSCNTGYELTHDDISECYETGEWEPEPPECIPLQCGRPDYILHGYFTGSVFSYKSVVNYQCDLGYKIIGSERRECLADATWSGSVPVCKPVSCGKPEAIENGDIIGRDFTLNNIVRYTCHPGFNLKGAEERICRETGKWANDAPVCVRVVCGVPAQVQNGFYFDTSFNFEDTVTYMCEDGYSMTGDAILECQSSGLWHPAPPQCLEILCAVPPSIHNGFLVNPDSLTSFKIGYRAQYICNEGHEFSLNSLNPTGQVECLGTGFWEANFPECVIIQCRDPLPIFNGYFNVESLNFKGTVTYGCDEGYRLNGVATMTCLADATWEGALPWCTAIKCEAPAYVRNGRVDFKDLTLGSVIRYMCNEGYTLEGLEVRRCHANLSWSGEDPYCKAISCGPPEDIADGTMQTDGETFQSTVTYNCNTGYYLVGDRTRLCTKDGVWSGAAAICEIVQCDKPSPVISNGRMIGHGFSYGSVIEYVCDEGYYIDGPLNKRRCLASGSWDSPIPVCVAVECPRLKVVNGATSGFQTEYGTTLTVTCKSGYRLEGDSERTCQQDGTWGGKETVCVRYACPRLTPPINGQVHVRGIDATYLCIEGFQLNGPPTRTCQADDTWSGSDPTCGAIMCEDITQTPFPNGFLMYESLEYGSSIVYECNTGYSLKGKRKLECMVGGQWDNAVPFCEKNKCFPPFAPLYSKIIGDDYSYGEVISYQCDEGYLMNGNAERTCQADGSWSGTAVTCDYIVCPRPEADRNVLIEGTDYTYNGTIKISCNRGYNLIGPKVRVCTETGQWSGDEPRCELNECPVPPPFANGRIIASSYDQGSRILYHCHEGYRLSGLSFRLCLSTLQWSGTDPFCVKVVCGPPPSLDNGFFTGSDFEYQDMVEYGCNEGYDLVGENRRRCLSVGRWGGADPTCIRVSCGVPRLPKHAVLSLPDGADAGAYEMTASLSCDEGFIGVGTNTQFCQASGEWTEANFECEIVQCGDFRGLRNGRFTGVGISYGDEVEIQCDEGYSLLGKRVGRCLASGEWGFGGLEPVCEEITCPELPPFSNGEFTYEGSSSAVGQAVVYNCDEGYRLQGDNKRLCQLDGTWGGADPYCRLIICLTPPFVTNAIPFDSTTQYFFKSEARYDCKRGYTISQGDAILTCSEKGDWSGRIPVCSVVQCGDPEPVAHSRINPLSNDYQSEAKYVCDEGYRIKGTVSPTIQCDENGNWVGTLPTCVPISCGEPPEVANSLLFDSQEHTFNTKVTYICEDGYKLIGQQTSTCLATGVWSGSPPICQPVSCGEPPDIDYAFYSGSKFEYKSKVVYSCAYGFEISGDPTLECLFDGAWSPNRPVCHQITCEHPPVIPNAMTESDMTAAVGSVAHFECNDGYYLIGSSEAFCLPNRQWDFQGQEPSCLEKDCGVPDDVDNGHVVYGLTMYQAEATYTCTKGYFVKGQSKRTCDVDGQWSGDAPFCEPVNCGRPVLNSHVQMAGTRFTFKDVVEYSCDHAYKLTGDKKQECLATGNWSGQQPTCHRITCAVLSYPKHATIVTSPGYDGNSYSGDVVSFVCDEGFNMLGKKEIECLDSGEWSDEPPKCNIDASLLRCSEVTGIPNVQSLDSPYPVGAVVDLTCRPGFTTNTVLQSTCQGDQSWTKPAGNCRRIFCGKPPLRDFVNVVRITGSSYFFEDKIKFRCRAGVLPARSPPVIRCLADGHWDGDIRCGVTCKQPCQNGGICLGLNRCKCPNGYGGRICQKAKCVLPCLNGGKCTQPYKCTCPAGYGDVRCNKALCQTPCQNGGRCVLPNKCKCAHGYSGAFCGQKRV